MAQFKFTWDKEQRKLIIECSGQRHVEHQPTAEEPAWWQRAWCWLRGRKDVDGEGCGRWIVWLLMTPVYTPEALFESSSAHTDDIPNLPSGTVQIYRKPGLLCLQNPWLSNLGAFRKVHLSNES